MRSEGPHSTPRAGELASDVQRTVFCHRNDGGDRLALRGAPIDPPGGLGLSPGRAEVLGRCLGGRCAGPAAQRAGCRRIQGRSPRLGALFRGLHFGVRPPTSRVAVRARPGLQGEAPQAHAPGLARWPAGKGCSGWNAADSDFPVESVEGRVYVGVVPGERILDSAACLGVLDRSRRMNCLPILWNHWERLPTDSARLATLRLGRAIECCAPIVLPDGDGIHELVELASRTKIPARRVTESSREAIVDLGYAWGPRQRVQDGHRAPPSRHRRNRVGSLPESQLRLRQRPCRPVSPPRWSGRGPEHGAWGPGPRRARRG